MAAQTSIRAVTHGLPHFFGYYDHRPWSADARHLLAMRASFNDRLPAETDALVLGTIDLEQGGAFTPFAQTTTWGWQQGPMLQWLPSTAGLPAVRAPAARPAGTVIYNTRSEERLVSTVHDLMTGQTRGLPRPIYAVHPLGHSALCLDYARLRTLHPTCGYAPGTPATDFAPADDGIWRMDLATGDSTLILSFAQVRDHLPDARSFDAANWLAHLTWNTDGSRFCFLHRWTDPQGPAGPWRTRLLTANADGSDLHLLNNHGMVSHFTWKNPRQLLAWTWHPDARGNHPGYYLLTDRTDTVEPLAPELLGRDGHMTYSPDGNWLLTDEYPGPDSAQPLILFDLRRNRRIEVGRFPTLLRGEIRCDLHPRFNADGTHICFDSAHEGNRQIYIADVSQIVLS